MDLSQEFHPYSKDQQVKHQRANKKQKDIPKDIRRFVLERDHRCCVRCGSPNGLHLHHLITRGRFDPKRYNFKQGLHDPHNLATVCFICHERIHKDPTIMKNMLSWQKKRFGEVLKLTNN